MSRPRADFHHALRAARTGAHWAHDQIFTTFAPFVLNHLKRRNAPEPEDLTNEVFIAVITSIHTFSGDEHRFRSWLRTIANRRLIDALRRHYRQPPTEPLDPSTDRPAPDDAHTLVEVALSTRHIVILCAKLPDDQRDVMLLRLLGGHTISEIATTLHKTPGAIKALQRRALRTLEHNLRHPQH